MEPLTCQELVELITAYLEETLPEAARQQVDRHLAGCEGCTHYLEQMRQTIQLTGRLREEQLTPQQQADLLTLFQDWKKS
jgi:anti-sigma factor RsiW